MTSGINSWERTTEQNVVEFAIDGKLKSRNMGNQRAEIFCLGWIDGKSGQEAVDFGTFGFPFAIETADPEIFGF